jgi:hypothetical protein
LKKKRNIKREVSIEIDKLTNSIENVFTGKVYDTEFHRLTGADKKQIKKKDWLFDWHDEIGITDRYVYKLTIKNNADIIQGLISFSIDDKFVFIYLAESARINQGKNKMYDGVAGNMFAFVCKRSKDVGFEGYVVFMAKTKLIEHYKNTLGAKLIGGQRMVIEGEGARKLITQYFKT